MSDQQKELDKLTDLMSREEDLLPELQEHLRDTDHWEVLQHPLLYAVPYTSMQNALYNEQYRHKVKLLDKARGENNWQSFVFLHERPYRFEALMDIMYDEDMTNEDYWKLLAECWVDSENLHQIWNLTDFLYIDRDNRQSIMNKQELALYNRLPEEFPVYRGHQRINEEGHSWTLSFSKADRFATRYSKEDQEAVISQAVCLKSWVVAVFLRRGEYEVVVECPDMLDHEDAKRIDQEDQFKEFREAAYVRFTLGKKSDHGPAHWEQVERLVIHLSQGMDEQDIATCRLFAIFHDCMRINEDDDPKHGLRAAKYIEKFHREAIIDLIGEDRFEKLKFAIEHHNSGGTTADPIIGRCWDSDRLDLIRVGIVPDSIFISTQIGRETMFKTV